MNSTATYAMIDFIDWDLSLPNSEFDIIADKLISIGFQKDYSGELHSNETCESLYDSMGKLTIRFGQYLFWIPPEAYTYSTGIRCWVGIRGWDKNYYVIGK